jgi:hypothetical protein
VATTFAQSLRRLATPVNLRLPTGAGIILDAEFFGAAASGDANATGSTVSVAVSLIAGAASATGDGNASGATVTATASLVAGAATGAASAGAATVIATASLVAGAATGGAAAAGATATATVSLLAGAADGGAAAGDGNAGGATIAATVSLIAGAATGDVATTLRGRHGRPWRDYDKIWRDGLPEDPPEVVAVVEPAPEPLPPAPRVSLNELFDVPAVAVKPHAQWVAEDDEDIELLMLA